MSLDDDPWVRAHSPVSAATMHALGYLTFAWNLCEYWTNAIFCEALSVSEATAHIITHDLGDITIWTKIVQIARHKKLPDATIEHLEYASKLYDRCRTNRNTYVHASAGSSRVKPGLRLMRVKGPSMVGSPIPDDIEDLRRVADEIRALRRYLEDLCLSLHDPPSATWPEKPHLPEFVWKPPSAEHPKSKRPRRSSRE